jgi:hypothetical protein
MIHSSRVWAGRNDGPRSLSDTREKLTDDTRLVMRFVNIARAPRSPVEFMFH